ncbi:hypothetical protein OF820_04265 [Oceanotoga sp. DSM 15011]|uniref:Uncharacterized protein n=1 Tax=Oceanotoga teriensis TaxID=515440 RepID=A0AA45HJH1_9BACT|nr:MULTISPECIES: hypothetical protein [Oceanotoga]MDN5343243.1 hypothetical protein [Oceanotoga sp.]PWJ95872.1 hypothetical protein C7380_10349 [Oceanotoga teriensis]UYP00903.1 hypothetical protein OF820_04265 [Oceanotoga sp. DSM 15011]
MKAKISILFLILSLIIGYSESEIKIKNIKNVYDNLINEIPLLRFINSKEGLGYSNVLNLITGDITSDATSLDNILNTGIIFKTNKDYTYEDFLNPDYINFLNDLIINSKSIAFYNGDFDTFKEIVKGLYEYEITQDGIIINDNKYPIYRSENFIGINTLYYEPNFGINIIEGTTRNFLKKNNSWDFYINNENKSLNAKFYSDTYQDLNLKFDIKTVENYKFFGDILYFHKMQKNQFISYIQEFFVPYEKEDLIFFDLIESMISSEEFLAVDSKSMINNYDSSIFVVSDINTKSIEDYMGFRNIEPKRLGTYDFALITNQNNGDKIYIYYSKDDMIITTLSPETMKVNLGEVQRFKYTKKFKALKKHENLNRAILIDFERYLNKKFYGNLYSYLVSEFYYDENGSYNIDVALK